MFTYQDIAQALALPFSEQEGWCDRVSIDSRAVQPKDLFIAISGPRFDGHDFIMDAVQAGAAAVVVTRRMDGVTVPQFVVEDPVLALGQLAQFHRQRLLSCQVVALTGSNGKTTVKEMIASILLKPVCVTQGNLNNHLGVPLSLLRLESLHDYAVFELGANHVGEIAYTAKLVKPQVALVNQVAPAHIGEFGSIEQIAQAKGEIYDALATGGFAIVNDDEPYAHFWDANLGDKSVIRFSMTHAADLYAEAIFFDTHGFASFHLITPKGMVPVRLRVPGKHNIANALAAASCAYALDIPLTEIASGLQRFMGVPGRLASLEGLSGAIVIDDTYNANLRSVLTAIEVLAKRKGRRIFVFGEMGELGEHSQMHHQRVGYAAREQGIDLLFTCGKLSQYAADAFGSSARHYETQTALLVDLKPYLAAGTTVLVKGSRASHMERIVEALLVESRMEEKH